MSSADGPSAKLQKTAEIVDTSATLPHLGEDDLVSILQWLPAANLIRLEFVSRLWQDVLVPRAFGQAKIKSIDLSQYAQWPKNWRNSSVGDNIDGFNIFRKLLDLMGSQLTSVSLKCADSRLGPAELQLLATKCPLLSHLDLTGVAVDPSALCQLGVQLRQLESLVIRDSCGWERDKLGVAVALMTNLKHLDVGGYQLRTNFLPAVPNCLESIALQSAFPLLITHLRDFIHKHPGLKRFRLSMGEERNFVFVGPASQYSQISSVATLLADCCSDLTHLSLGITYRPRDTAMKFGAFVHFFNVFSSLPNLKELDLSDNILVTPQDIKNLSDNCPDVEVLSVDTSEHFKMAVNPTHFDGLRKLRRLSLGKFAVNDEFVTALCEVNGATLEYLRLRSNLLTDASLQAMAVSCVRLAEVHFDDCGKFTKEEISRFIDTITSQPSWTDPLKNRKLRILAKEMNVRTNEIQLDQYGGRVVFSGKI